jgi:hypothetical protein
MSLNVVPVTLKVPEAMIQDAETVMKNSPGFELGMSITRTDILRIAMRRGLDGLMAQQQKTSSTSSKTSSKRSTK